MSKLGVKVDYVCQNLVRVEQEVAANLIRELYLQRAELLEALKSLMYWENGKSEWVAAQELINKVEKQ